MNIRKTLQEKVAYYLPDWRQRWHEGLFACRRWLRALKFQTIKLIGWYLAAVLCFILVFGMANSFWLTLQHTPVGTMFLGSHPPAPLIAIFTATSNHLLPQAFRLTYDTALTCLLLGSACQLLAITRYCYTDRGLLNRLSWFALCAVLTSMDLLDKGQPYDLTTGTVLYLVPAVCLASHCLEFSAMLFPEIWIVLKLGELRHFCTVAKIRNTTNFTKDTGKS